MAKPRAKRADRAVAEDQPSVIDAAPAKNWPGIIVAVGRSGSLGQLALVTLALWAILLAWLYYASSTQERITAGILMVIVLLTLVGAVILIEWIRRLTPPPEVQQAFATLDKAGVSLKEIEQVQASASKQPLLEEPIAAPDQSYTIKRPPAGWTVRVTSAEAILKEKLFDARTISNLPQGKISVLEMGFGDPSVLSPQPGQTRVNGRRVPLLLSEPFGRGLRILSLRRRQPPIYIERTLYDTVVSQLSLMAVSGVGSVTSITPGKLPKTDRDIVLTQVTQKFENILLGGHEVDVMRVNIGLMAIRGDLYDYLLVATNFRLGGGSDPVADQMDGQVAELLDSFRLLSVADPVGEARKDSERADQEFDEFVSTTGSAMFAGQFGIAVQRFKEMDLNSKADIDRAISLLRPFRTYAGMLPHDDSAPDLSELWTALDQAEKGKTQPLRDLLLTLVAEQADATPPVALSPPQSATDAADNAAT
jgi:hypothetical protein